jgi:hypothetical protein
MEEYRPITGYENYVVSNLGNVMNISTGKLLKPFYNYGYEYVSLSKKSRSKNFRVHRLVALAFIPNPENKPTVNHADGDKHNNAASNLEWATSKEQTAHAMKTGLKHDRKRGRAVLQFDKAGNLIKEWQSVPAITNELGYNSTAIYDCCSGKLRTAYKCIWKFK